MKKIGCREELFLIASFITVTGGYLTSTPQLWSPNYPSDYPNNTAWSVQLSSEVKDHVFHMSFSHFDVEYSRGCTHDYLVIYDGNSDTSPQLGRFCGSSIPPDMYSTQGQVLVKFHTDARITRSGFSMNANSLYKDYNKVPKLRVVILIMCITIPSVAIVVFIIKYKELKRRKKDEDLTCRYISEHDNPTIPDRASSAMPCDDGVSVTHEQESSLPSYSDVIKHSEDYFTVKLDQDFTQGSPSYMSIEQHKTHI